MRKINFQDGTKISSAKVTIDETDYTVTPAYYEGATPLTATVLNTMESYMEEAVTADKETSVAKSLTITDAAGVNGKIDIVNGETVQTTYTGKNLFNATSASHTSKGITLSGDREFIYANGTGSSENRGKYASMTLPAGTYTFSAKYISGSITGGFSIYLYKGDTWTQIGSFTLNSNTSAQNYITFTLTEETEVSLYTYITTSKSFTNVKIQYQLTQGEDADYNFEPYVGGKSSPSPDYPQEISNCNTSIRIKVANGTDSSASGYVSQTITFPLAEGQELCKINDTYKDKIVLHNGEWVIEKNVKKIQRNVSDMNNEENYPGWNDMTELATYYPSKNLSFVDVPIYIKSNVSNDNNAMALNTNGSNKIFYFKKAYFNDMTQTQWKTNYPDLVFTLYYSLPTPEYISLTTEQKVALNQLQHAEMYQEVTYIECIDEVKPDIKATYLFDNDINNYYGDALDNKQDTLVSGINIKTINNESIVGSGNITIQGGGSSITVHDSYNTSTTEPYSCNYVNTVVGNIETLLSQI